MTKSRIVVTEKDRVRPICPGSTILLSNAEDKYQELVALEQHWLPAYEQPEVRVEGHIISLHLSDPVNFENNMKGKWSTDILKFRDVCITPHQIQFQARWQEPIETLMLRLDADWLRQIALENFESENCELNLQIGKPDLFIYSLILNLRNELANGYQGGKMYSTSLLNSLAVHLLAQYSTRSLKLNLDRKGLTRIQQSQAIAFIKDNFNHNIKLADISLVVGLSEFYFNRQFKHSLGITPHQYLIQYRIDRAKQLLKQKNINITQIAKKCGFSTQSYFTKQFRQIVGVTPMKYRKEIVPANGSSPVQK